MSSGLKPSIYCIKKWHRGFPLLSSAFVPSVCVCASEHSFTVLSLLLHGEPIPSSFVSLLFTSLHFTLRFSNSFFFLLLFFISAELKSTEKWTNSFLHSVTKSKKICRSSSRTGRTGRAAAATKQRSTIVAGRGEDSTLKGSSFFPILLGEQEESRN
jgi:hypothetical protein